MEKHKEGQQLSQQDKGKQILSWHLRNPRSTLIWNHWRHNGFRKWGISYKPKDWLSWFKCNWQLPTHVILSSADLLWLKTRGERSGKVMIGSVCTAWGHQVQLKVGITMLKIELKWQYKAWVLKHIFPIQLPEHGQPGFYSPHRRWEVSSLRTLTRPRDNMDILTLGFPQWNHTVAN